jgi:hypothetical protein
MIAAETVLGIRGLEDKEEWRGRGEFNHDISDIL